MFKIKVDAREVSRMFNDFTDMGREVMKDAYRFYKSETPVRSGNARNKTKLRNKQIKSGYPYAGRLDEGWSKQAPKGMTEPTMKEIDNLIDIQITRLTK